MSMTLRVAAATKATAAAQEARPVTNSPMSVSTGTLTVSQCEMRGDGSSVPLTVEVGGSAIVTGAVFRSTAGDMTAVSVAEGGSLSVGESQLISPGWWKL